MQELETNTKKENKPTQYILFKSINPLDKANFYEYLSVMIDGGVSITEALSSVESKISWSYFNEKIWELITYISSWDSFSKAMKKMPDVFSSAEISIIEAGEQIWGLVESLWKLSEDLKKVYNLKKKVKWALTYPLIIFLFLFLAILIVLIYVIPAIIPLFANSDVELPAATNALIATSDFLKWNFGLLILFIASSYVALIWYKTTSTGKEQLDNFYLQLPLIWDVYRNYLLSNISANLWSLIWSGVTVMTTLKLVWRSCWNEVYKQLFDTIMIRVSKWDKIVESMRDIDPLKLYFPSDFTQMLGVWEKTANLEKISRKINAQYEKEVEYSLESLTKWIEPLAILLAWLFVTWFAFAIFGAILKVTQTVW